MFIRDCPKCGKTIHYTRADTVQKANVNLSVCASCRTALNNQSPKRNAKKDKNPSWRGFGSVPGKVHSKLKRDAGVRSIPFDLSIEEINQQYENQNKLCAFTGMPLQFGLDASVDRIDSNQGYNFSNIQIVHKDLNMMKKDLPNEVFIAWCRLVANHGKE